MTSSIGLCRSHSCVQRLDLDPVEIAVGDKQHEVGIAHRLLGELAAQLAGRLVDARRVDQDKLGVLEPALGHLVGRAVLGGNGEDPFAGERIEQRALARADLAEGGDLEAAVLQLRVNCSISCISFSMAGALLRAQPGVRRRACAALRWYRAISDLVLHGRGSAAIKAAWNRSGAPGRGRKDAAQQVASARAIPRDGRAHFDPHGAARILDFALDRARLAGNRNDMIAGESRPAFLRGWKAASYRGRRR